MEYLHNEIVFNDRSLKIDFSLRIMPRYQIFSQVALKAKYLLRPEHSVNANK